MPLIEYNFTNSLDNVGAGGPAFNLILEGHTFVSADGLLNPDLYYNGRCIIPGNITVGNRWSIRFVINHLFESGKDINEAKLFNFDNGRFYAKLYNYQLQVYLNDIMIVRNYDSGVNLYDGVSHTIDFVYYDGLFSFFIDNIIFNNMNNGFPMPITTFNSVFSSPNILFDGQSNVSSNYFFIKNLTIRWYNDFPCFKEDTKILTDKGYIPIQDLRKGDLVKTLKNDFKPINMIGKRCIYHSASEKRVPEQLYICCSNEYPEVFEDLILTGCHSILVENSKDIVNSEQIEKVKEVNGGIYLTDDMLRLPSCVDLRSSVYSIPGTYTIYHLALDNEDYYMNYGIYANGLLVESCSKRYLKELSSMELIE